MSSHTSAPTPLASRRQRRPEWKRTQFAVVASVFLWFAGQNFFLPFLPLYIRELGDLTIAETGIWSGVVIGVTPLVSGSLAPVWGAMADRFGRKIMMQRSLIGFAICLGFMGVAQEPWHLLAVRTAMGVFGGFASAATAIVTTVVPRDQMTSAVGRVQTARVLGLAAGPLPGGIIADVLGYRAASFASMGAAILGLLIVSILVTNVRSPVSASSERDAHFPARKQLLGGGFLSILFVGAAIRAAEKSFDPVLPLVITQLNPSGIGVASATAIITSAGLLSAAIASSSTDRLVRRRTRDTGLTMALAVAGVAFVGIFFAPNWWTILLLRVAVGAGLGVGLTLAYSAIAAETPERRRGLVLGILGAGTSYGSAAGSALGGLLTPIAVGLVFLADSALLLGSSVIQHWFRGRGGEDLKAPPSGHLPRT